MASFSSLFHVQTANKALKLLKLLKLLILFAWTGFASPLAKRYAEWRSKRIVVVFSRLEL